MNDCSREEFVAAVGSVFEHSPWVARVAAGRRPFASRRTLHEAMCLAVREAGEEKQLALIRSHPDLVGRVALTAESNLEQAAAGLMDLSRDEAARFDHFNAEYKARFGFPFVICARQSKKDAILAAFPVRLRNSREVEVATALEQIYQIAELRLSDIIS
ncbi:MAG TPA: 2-oxo-4-hydroxy-4-carboxy-5-ureidoimidazoline decarboxylase [Verrucomicrobiaceae bacterium]